MGYKETYQEWLTNPYFDEETRMELKKIENDEKEIEDRFYTELEFGTAGLRGVIGAGMNRMNIYTVRQATQGRGFYTFDFVRYEDAPANVAEKVIEDAKNNCE